MARVDLSGIYAIEHLASGRFYIGSSRQCWRRKSQHWYCLRLGKHLSKYLQFAWNKYGEDAFEFYILEECGESELIIREQAYLDAFRPVFNVCTIAGRVTSPKVNARRAASLRSRAARITHCPRGHAYDDANTHINKKGKRICRACAAERMRMRLSTENEMDRAQRLRRMNAYFYQHRDYLLKANRERAKRVRALSVG